MADAADQKEETQPTETNDLDKEIEALTEGQRKTYDALVEKDLKGVTPTQLVKAAQEFGVDLDSAVTYLTEHDPDAGDQVAEPNFLTEVTTGDKVDSTDQREAGADLETGSGDVYEHTQRCASYEINLISGLLNIAGLIAAWTCAFVFEQYYLMGVTGCNWYWATQTCAAVYYKFLTVKASDKEITFRWNVSESNQSCWWTRTLKYADIESFARKEGVGQGETCSSNELVISGNGCKCMPCKACKNADCIDFNMKSAFHFNCCTAGNRKSFCASMCGCFDQNINVVRVSTDDLKELADFLQRKGVKEEGSNAANI